jgi:hypothetical protein
MPSLATQLRTACARQSINGEVFEDETQGVEDT